MTMDQVKETSLEGATSELGNAGCNVITQTTQTETCLLQSSPTDTKVNFQRSEVDETSDRHELVCEVVQDINNIDETGKQTKTYPTVSECSEEGGFASVGHRSDNLEFQKHDGEVVTISSHGSETNGCDYTIENSSTQLDASDTYEVTESCGDCPRNIRSELLPTQSRDLSNALSLDLPFDQLGNNLMSVVSSEHSRINLENVVPEEPEEELSTGGISSADDTDDDSVDYGGFTVNRVASDDSDSVNQSNPDGSQRIEPSNDQEADTSVSRRLERARRKRLHRLLLDSSSSSSSSDGNDDDDQTANNTSKEIDSDIDLKSDQLDCEENSLDQRIPVDTWNSLCDVYGREIGFLSRRQTRSHNSFTRCVGGSALLASKLILYDKHEVHGGCVNALHFNETGSLIASGSDDLKVVIFDWIKKRTFIHFDSGHRSNVFQAKFLPHSGDCHLVTCARDGQVRLAQLSVTGSCNRTKKLASHRQAVHKLALLNDSPHIFYSCGEDSVVFQIDLRQEQPNKCYVTKENDRCIPLYSIHCNPSNSNEHCVGGRDQYIRIYDVRMLHGTDDKKPLVKKFCPHHLLTSDYKAHTTCAVYNYNGSEIIGSYNDDDIYLFDSAHSDGAQHVHKYFGHRNNATVKGVNFYGPKSEFIVSGSDCGNVFIWHKQSEKIINYFHADDGGVVNVLEPHPHLPLLATSGLDNDIKLWLPSGSTPVSLANLHKVVNKNLKERESDRNEPDVLDSQMLWFLMHTLRRNAARRAASAADGNALFSEMSDVSEDSDSDGDSSGNANQSQCTTS